MSDGSAAWKSSALCIACSCHLQDVPAWASTARYVATAARRSVYMHFFLRAGVWICNFFEPDVKTAVGPIRTTRNEEKLRETITRGGGIQNSEDRNMIDYGIKEGRGSAWLELTADQYRLLKVDQRKPPQAAR